jgi:acetolactate synthase I/II/III large subunit
VTSLIKLSDFIVNRLEENGVKHVFMVSGGGAMHLNDSFGKSRIIQYISNHHEQASAVAAEGYARATGQMAVVNVTTGPGGTNALTGVIGSYFDSAPVLFISGQVKFETTIHSCPELGLRQLGDQEVNIVEMVKPVTKYAVMVTDPQEIKYHLDKAIHFANTGRPGPVWLDIPLDVQGALIDDERLLSFTPPEDFLNEEELKASVAKVIEILKTAQRPVVIAGRGIRISEAQNLFFETFEKLNIPILSTFNGMDIVPTTHPLFKGRIGTIGDRAGNFTLQNSDCIICIGTRNNIRQISYMRGMFGREATKIIVDIDEAELKKPTIKADLPIHADAKAFISELKMQSESVSFPGWEWWNEWSNERKKRYTAVLPEYKEQAALVNPYYFTELLTSLCEENDIFISANATPSIALFQAGIIKPNQQVIMNSGSAAMGYDLPAAIGAAVSKPNHRIICLVGEGSLMMNLQELQTIIHHQLPIKIFIYNNNGYSSIKQTQENLFAGRYVASGPTSGVTFPDLIKVAEAFGYKTRSIQTQSGMEDIIQEVLDIDGPVVCNVKLPSDYKFTPKLSSERKPDGTMVSKPLEDMYPFLDREEFKDNMLIPLWEEIK